MKAKISASTIKKLTPQDKPYEVVDTEIKGFILRVQPTGRQTFYYSYRNEASKRQRIKIGMLGPQLTVQQAKDQAVKYASEVLAGKDIQKQKQSAKRKAIEEQQNTLELFIANHYLPWATANLKSGQQSVDRVNYSFTELLGAPLGEITIQQIEKWRTFKLKSGLKPSTINRCVNSLRAVMSKAVEWQLLDEHPLKGLKALKIDSTPKVRYLTQEEEERLDAALNCRDNELKAARQRGNSHRVERGYEPMEDISKFTYADRMTPLVTLSLKTGMRRGELFDLLWEDVDFSQKVITVKAATAKSNNTRHIPISPKGLLYLKAWKSQSTNLSGRVFPADNGGRLDNVRKSWATILKLAEIQDFRWHDMRHDFASKLVMKGVPLNTVRELCGHADLNTTLRYAHLAPDHKSEAVALLD